MKEFLKKNGAWIGFLLLAIAFTVLTEGNFLSPRNLSNVLRQAALNGILAGGMTLVILTGGIDLSVGSLVALCGIVAGLMQVHAQGAESGFFGAWLTIATAVITGLLAGILNGVLIATLRIAPFVITLGMMVIARGLAMIFSQGTTIAPMSEAFSVFANEYLGLVASIVVLVLALAALLFQVLRQTRTAWRDLALPVLTFASFAYAFLAYRGFPVLGLFLLGVFGFLSLILMRTTLGRAIYALGSNERAAYFAGIPIGRVTLAVYAIMGLLSGLTGALLTARLNGADPNAGQLFELDAIAAVVIGGTSLRGGQGHLAGSLVGALTIATLNNGMDLMGVPSFYQMVFKGVVIILAVSLDRGQRRSV